MNIELISQGNSFSQVSAKKVRDYWSLVYLISGELTATLNSYVYEMHQGSIMLVSPEDFYFIKENGFSNYRIFDFKVDMNDGPKLISKVLNLDVEDALLSDKLSASNTMSQNQTILQLLILSIAEWNVGPEPLKDEKARLFRDAVGLMERYIASSLSVDELARMIGISLAGLKRIFARFTGGGAHDYFLMLKINKAKELLAQGNSVTRTARVLQFSSQAYFSTAFKRIAGISAKSYASKKIPVSEPRKRKRRVAGEGVSQSRSSLPDYLL